MVIVKSSADLFVLLERMVRFQSSKPRYYDPKRTLVCVSGRGRDVGVFGWLARCTGGRGHGRAIIAATLNER
jgi:hypothetical protein